MTRRTTVDERARYAFIHEIGISAASGRAGDIHCAHLRSGAPVFGKHNPGMARKPHWVWTLPLLVEEHHQQHRMNERQFWESFGFDWLDPIKSPLAVALALEGFRALGDADAARAWLQSRVA